MHGRYKGLLFLLGVFLLWCARSRAEEMMLTVPAKIHPFVECTIRLTLPEDGVLTIGVTDGYGVQKPLAEQQPVQEGELEIPYDGCSFEGMPLMSGKCIFSVELLGESGTQYQTEAVSKIGSPGAAVEYALPRSRVYYTEQKTGWKVDCGISGGETVLLEIFSDKAMTQRVAKVARHVPGKSMFTFVWKGWFGKKRAEAGKYWCRVMLKDQPETAKTFTLEVEEGPEPVEPLRITGPLLPETDDPDELLELLCAPLTVVDIDATAHQKIYAEPGERGGVLGRVHGQSQGLCVLEIGEKYTKVGAWRHEDGAYIEGYVPTKLLKIVRPYEHYGVVVDKPLQELRVYEYGRLVGRMRISTGLMEKNELVQETRAGAFITTDRMITFESHGFDYDYPIRIDGGNLLHQLGRVSPEQGGFSAQMATLGQKASAGCVRMDYRTDAAHTINAYWLWTHLEWGTKVLVLDDPDAREARLAELGE